MAHVNTVLTTSTETASYATTNQEENYESEESETKGIAEEARESTVAKPTESNCTKIQFCNLKFISKLKSVTWRVHLEDPKYMNLGKQEAPEL